MEGTASLSGPFFVESLISASSFVLVVFSVNTLLQCRKIPWLAVIGEVILGMYYLTAFLSQDHTPFLANLGIMLINLSLVITYSRGNIVVEKLREVLHSEVHNPKSPITLETATRLERKLNSERAV